MGDSAGCCLFCFGPKMLWEAARYVCTREKLNGAVAATDAIKIICTAARAHLARPWGIKWMGI